MRDERYAAEEYVYGTEPNAFLKEHAQRLAGPVLSVAEGEGRNAVFLASLGLEVLGVDGSTVGLAKARRLAEAKGVSIDTLVVDLADYEPPAAAFGAVVSIFAHLPSRVRGRLNCLLERSLRPGGLFLLEAYRPEQLGRGTGGPADVDMLVSRAALEAELPECEVLLAREIEREVVEGRFPPARPAWSSSSPGRGSSPRGGRRNASNLWNAGCILPARVPLWQDGQGRYQWIVVPLDQGFDACNGFSCWWA